MCILKYNVLQATSYDGEVSTGTQQYHVHAQLSRTQYVLIFRDYVFICYVHPDLK